MSMQAVSTVRIPGRRFSMSLIDHMASFSLVLFLAAWRDRVLLLSFIILNRRRHELPASA